MSYIVLARKWRPQGFDDLVGQETVVTTLKNALSGGKIAHAYLFSGPRGVGKTSSARILAKALNCEQRADSEPCGQCQNCKAITDGYAVDVLEIDGASNNSVEAVRELRETVKYAPSGGKYKIYIIDEVHMLSASAFNALLKTLEEPPPHVVFIFATTEPKKVPATILSRCQHHSFRRVTKGRIKEQLRKITDAEKITIKDAALDMIAKAADGSMRDALTLLDQAYSFSDEISEKELQSLLGLPESEIISGLTENILRGDIAQTLSIIKELTDRGSDLRQMAKELVEQFRNIAVAKITDGAAALLEFTDEEVQHLRDSARDISIEELTLLLTELLRVEAEVRTAANPRYVLELGLLRTSFVKGMTSVEQLLKMIGEPEGQHYVRESSPKTSASRDTQKSSGHSETVSRNSVAEINKPGGAASDKRPVPQPEKKTEPIQQHETDGRSAVINKEEIWQDLLAHLDATDHLLACKLAEAKLVNLTAAEMTISFNGGMSFLADLIKKNAPVIEPLLRKLSGHSIRLKVLSLPQNGVKRDLNTIKEQVAAEPIVQDAMRIFNSSLINVKPLDENANDNDVESRE
ncbi:MAG: DNA polymerase III subunit gamma/tau [Nitrospiraceae bacterium]|nr:MAG: DNA polymerase III subunit gamma/tau [Nitrospiraceae bacterium]